jgi:hypothetical protein
VTGWSPTSLCWLLTDGGALGARADRFVDAELLPTSLPVAITAGAAAALEVIGAS